MWIGEDKKKEEKGGEKGSFPGGEGRPVGAPRWRKRGGGGGMHMQGKSQNDFSTKGKRGGGRLSQEGGEIPSVELGRIWEILAC